MLSLHKPEAEVMIPDGKESGAALARTTRLGIGAHQDDLEFMAMAGILASYSTKEEWFGGITCTDGGGSARTGAFAGFSDEQMRKARREEQRQAARIGQYSFIAQLAYPSAEVKAPARRQNLVQDLVQLLQATRPTTVYTHNPFDRHDTHIAVLRGAIEAIRKLPQEARPSRLLGCEVWRSLDWLPEDRRVAEPLDSHPGLAGKLNKVFRSQIEGGKRYDLAVEGRRQANATFQNPHRIDEAKHIAFSIDLSDLIEDDDLCLEAFAEQVIRDFRSETEGILRG